jgi:hypothetical protein
MEKKMKNKRYKIIKGLFYFEIVDKRINRLVGSQETLAAAKKIIKKLEGGK